MSVRRAAPKIIWPRPADIFEGTRLSAVQLNATVDFADFGPHIGVLVYDPPLNAKLEIGLHELKVTFVPTEGERDNFDFSSGCNVFRTEQLVAPVRGLGKRG